MSDSEKVKLIANLTRTTKHMSVVSVFESSYKKVHQI